MADFLRLQLEQAGGQGGGGADALAVVCQVARMPLGQLYHELSQLPGAGRKQEPGLDGEEASSKETEVSRGGGRHTKLGLLSVGCWLHCVRSRHIGGWSRGRQERSWRRCAHCCRQSCTAL